MCNDEFSCQPAGQVIAECSADNCENKWHDIQRKVDEIMKDKELEEIDKRLEEVKEEGIFDDFFGHPKGVKIALIEQERYEFLIERNKRITEVYKTTAQKNPENRWAKLASYVSAQAGCGMKETRGFEAQTGGKYWYDIDPDKALNALSDANKEIFSSVGMPFMFISEYGYEEFYKCAKVGNVDNSIIKAARKMEGGELKEAADILAEKEQLEIVEPIYGKYEETFRKIDHADTHEPFYYDDSRNRQSIALEYECDKGEKIKLGDHLQLKNKEDRVKYYERLLKAMP